MFSFSFLRNKALAADIRTLDPIRKQKPRSASAKLRDDSLNIIWVLLINGNTDKEGIYMLQEMNSDMSYVIGFEDFSDATLFASNLRKSFYTFTPTKWTTFHLDSLCESLECDKKIVYRGEAFEPPKKNKLLESDDTQDSWKLVLENMLLIDPENCNDEDCTP